MNGNNDFGELLDGLAIARKGVILIPELLYGRVQVQNWKWLLSFIQIKRRKTQCLFKVLFKNFYSSVLFTD